MGPRFRGDDVLIGFARSRPTKKARSHRPGFFQFAWIGSLRGFVRDSRVVTIGVDIRLAVGLGIGFSIGLGLGAATRALGELAFDFLDRFGFRYVLHDSDFARQAIERSFVKLTFAVGLLGLRFGAIEIAHDL